MLTAHKPSSLLPLVSLFAFAAPALAEDDPGKVKEEATGVEFVAKAADGKVLAGAGVRRKLLFNVYAAGLYVPAEKLRKALDGKTDAKSLYTAIIYGEFAKRIEMHFVRSVSGDKIKEAFKAALEANMAAEDLEAEKGNLERFYKICEGTGVGDGDVFEFTTDGSKVRVSMSGKEIYTADSVRLARGMWMGWFGTSPVCEKLRDALVSRVPAILK